jgi:hypothetical protein
MLGLGRHQADLSVPSAHAAPVHDPFDLLADQEQHAKEMRSLRKFPFRHGDGPGHCMSELLDDTRHGFDAIAMEFSEMLDPEDAQDLTRLYEEGKVVALEEILFIEQNLVLHPPPMSFILMKSIGRLYPQGALNVCVQTCLLMFKTLLSLRQGTTE